MKTRLSEWLFTISVAFVGSGVYLLLENLIGEIPTILVLAGLGLGGFSLRLEKASQN